MNDKSKTKEHLIQELTALRRQVKERTRADTQWKGTETELLEGEHKLYSIIQGLPIPVFVIGMDHKILYWNRALEELSKIKAVDVIGTTQHWRAFYRSQRPCMADLLLDGDIEAISKRYNGKFSKSNLIEGAYEATDFFPYLGEKGRWLRFTGATIRDLEGNLVGAIETLEDISDRKHAEENLQKSEERYRAIIEGIEDGYFEVDVKGNMTFCNPSAVRILGYTQEELIGRNNRQYMDDENARKVFSAFNTMYRTGVSIKTFDWELIRKGGEKIAVETSVSLIRDNEGRPVGFRGIVRDITERKRMEVEIREMSLRDQLTELYNRRGFMTLAEQQIRAANRAKRQILLSFIDVDGMKWINDTLGHEEGDRALIDTAAILRQTFRESDIIARMGGDEFAVLAIEMTDLNPDGLSIRLQQAIDDWNAKESRPYKLDMSWGTAIYEPESSMSLDRLLSLSDELMYTQKKAKISRGI